MQTLIFEVNSLEVVPTLLLSTEPRNVRSLRSEEVSATHQLLSSTDQSEAGDTRNSRSAVVNSIYIGRARKNRRVGRPFTDEPCLYIVFPHLSEGYGLLLRQLQQLVILPSFEKALAEYELPQIPGGAIHPVPLTFRRTTSKDPLDP